MWGFLRMLRFGCILYRCQNLIYFFHCEIVQLWILKTLRLSCSFLNQAEAKDIIDVF